MQATSHPVLRDLVLVGGGHSHVMVLRHLAMQPEPGLRVTLICTDVDTPYSGMLPGYIAGHYGFDDVHIDLFRLCAFAGVRFIQGRVNGLDRQQRRVLLHQRPAIAYDLLSINTGSTPHTRQVMGADEHSIPVKPIAGFNQRWLALLAQVQTLSQALTITVVGGGAGGVELVLAMQYRLRQCLHEQGRPAHGLRFVLLNAGPCILPTHNPRVRARFVRELQQREVQVHTQAEVCRVEAKALHTRDGRRFATDHSFWVTQAGGPAWLSDTGLALDDSGFIRVNEYLQTLSDPRIFAAGDVAAFTPRPLEKAGVFAVRMGMPLAHNLRRSLHGQPLKAYRPQRHWLALISTGARYAVASRGPLGFWGAWVWRWKDQIDRRFMRPFQQLPVMAASHGPTRPVTLPLTAAETQEMQAASHMRCGGCGAKVSASIISRTLRRLQPIANDDVLLGLHAGDDAAVVRVPPGKAMVHTVDFFRSFLDDPYLFGKIAANHALGDIFAMGAQPQTATAILTLPPGLQHQVSEQLLHIMTGALDVLNAAGCSLVGGHSGEGQELALGFAINGLIDEPLQGLMRKGCPQVGDCLLLTKPLGTGTLMAAHARHQARGRWIAQALTQMQTSSQNAAHILHQHGARCCTDVTGFGLLGHVLELLGHADPPIPMAAELHLNALPVLDGALQTLQSGIQSSLHAANRESQHVISNVTDFMHHPAFPLLFDPQTVGGLLACVPPQQVSACLSTLQEAGYCHASVIGCITAASSHQPERIRLTGQVN
ncbi:MAG: selenide, water dikinase SelD [Pseudomonadota bacterium]